MITALFIMNCANIYSSQDIDRRNLVIKNIEEKGMLINQRLVDLHLRKKNIDNEFSLEKDIEIIDPSSPYKELIPSNVKSLLKNSTVVIDAFDNTVSRQIVQDECRIRKIPCLHAGLFEDYGEVIWDQYYTVPKQVAEGDVCDYPLARNIVMMTVVVAAEEILDFCLSQKPRMKNWSITLKDLKIKQMDFI